MKKAISLAMVFLTAVTLMCGCTNTKKPENTAEGTIGDMDIKYDTKSIVGSSYSFLQAEKPKAGDTIVTFTTTKGVIRAVLYADKAPKAVENFVTHAKDGYYNGVIFHRIIPNFMIQTGDPNGTGTGGESIWGGKFETELPEGLYHFRGALAMARTAQMNTNGSQFYFVQNPTVPAAQNTATGEAKQAYNEVGGYPSLDQKYTVFGQVIQGLDVVDAIAKAGSSSGAPSEKIYIETISVATFE